MTTLFDVDLYTVFLGLTGSHAYGTARPGSDVDVRGACLVPGRVRESFYQTFEQFLSENQKGPWGDNARRAVEVVLRHPTAGPAYTDGGEVLDLCVYSIHKYVALAANANPNVLELLFLDDRDVLFTTPAWDRLREHRDLFLSKKCRHTYTGYAMSQLKRIKGHRAWLLNPPKAEPTRAEFGLPEESVLPADVRNQIDEAVSKIIRDWGVEDGLDEHIKGAPQDVLRERMADFQATVLNCTEDMLDERTYELAGASLGLTKDVLYAIKQERRYRAARKHWEQFKRWERDRNPARAELEAKHGYDCYSADTQFLTDSGWKYFDEVGQEDMLATMYVGRDMQHRRLGALEYQEPLERFDGTFTGNLYAFKGYHTDVLVTPNHRMLHRQVSRRKDETYGITMTEAARLPDAFDFFRTIRPRKKRYSTQDLFANLPIKPEAFLRLMGWYLSDGTASKPKGSARVKDVRVSQKKGGRLHRGLSRFHGQYGKSANATLHSYDRESGTGERITEMVLVVRNKIIRERLVSECGRKKDKRIPRWVFGLSKRMMEILFDAMCGGDGTVRPTSKRSWIYYSSLEGLADDVNELAVHCGWETSRWGPYPSPTDWNPDAVMYQVHVDKKAKRFQRFVRHGAVETVPVKNHRIVCFTVPNGTLITRRNGRVGIHGNSKHGAHLIRLLRTGLEILRDGELLVRRPDAEELAKIRDGYYTYDDLMAEAESLQEAMKEAAKDSALPEAPDRERIDEVLFSILETA